MPEQPSVGLMQALAPIAARRPVHIIVSAGAAEGALHVVCQPLQAGKDEDPEIARGFSVEDTPAELDASLPGHVATIWVPAHQGLQNVLDQIAAHAEQAKQAALRKQKETGGKGKRDKDAGAADGGAQTTLAPPPAESAAPSAAVAAPAPRPAAEAAASPPPATATVAPAEPALAAAAAGDGISSLFD